MAGRGRATRGRAWPPQCVAFLIACGLVGTFAFSCHAQKTLLDEVRKRYMLDKRNGNCRLCHIIERRSQIIDTNGNTPLNAYGATFRAEPLMRPLLKKKESEQLSLDERDLFAKVLRKLEVEDSDHDGASNLEELELGTFPGDMKSTPGAADLAKYRDAHPWPARLQRSDATPMSPAPVALPKTKDAASFPIELVVAGAFVFAFAIVGWRKLKATHSQATKSRRDD